MIESLQEQIHALTGQTNPKDCNANFKKTLGTLKNTRQLEEIPLEEQMKSLTTKQRVVASTTSKTTILIFKVSR